jgi:hypothetical protein
MIYFHEIECDVLHLHNEIFTTGFTELVVGRQGITLPFTSLFRMQISPWHRQGPTDSIFILLMNEKSIIDARKIFPPESPWLSPISDSSGDGSHMFPVTKKMNGNWLNEKHVAGADRCGRQLHLLTLAQLFLITWHAINFWIVPVLTWVSFWFAGLNLT